MGRAAQNFRLLRTTDYSFAAPTEATEEFAAARLLAPHIGEKLGNWRKRGKLISAGCLLKCS